MSSATQYKHKFVDTYVRIKVLIKQYGSYSLAC